MQPRLSFSNHLLLYFKEHQVLGKSRCATFFFSSNWITVVVGKKYFLPLKDEATQL